MTALVQTLDVPARLNPGNVRLRMEWVNGKPMFCLADLCQVLGYKDVSDMTRQWVETIGKGNLIFGVNHPKNQGRGRTTTYDKWYCTEAQMYRVILQSGMPAAEEFTEWVTEEVIPSIRKTGSYQAPDCRRPSEAPALLQPYTARVVSARLREHEIPAGHWTVFQEGAELLITAELACRAAGLVMDQFDLLDGSIGAMWAKHRLGQEWAGERVRYAHRFPEDDRRGEQAAWAYPDSELLRFRSWLRKDYEQNYFPAYLAKKYGKAEAVAALPAIRSSGIRAGTRLLASSAN